MMVSVRIGVFVILCDILELFVAKFTVEGLENG